MKQTLLLPPLKPDLAKPCFSSVALSQEPVVPHLVTTRSPRTRAPVLWRTGVGVVSCRPQLRMCVVRVDLAKKGL